MDRDARNKLIEQLFSMNYLEVAKIAGIRARVDQSFLDEFGTLVQATRENIVMGLAALESEVKRGREAADMSSKAITLWTKVLAGATIVLAVATVALVWATLHGPYSSAVQTAAVAQTSPTLGVERR